jgi:hypothetical protein
MSELIFEITQEADGGFCADCLTESIFTQGDSWDQLRDNAATPYAPTISIDRQTFHPPSGCIWCATKSSPAREVAEGGEPGHHRFAVPDHAVLRIGTLSSILRAVSKHKGVDRDALLRSFR